MEFDIQCLQYMALESTIACDPEDYGLPDEKKYPMPDKKHVLLAIKFFNSTEDPEKQKILAANINKRIKDFNMESEVNVGDKNRFKKFWKPSTEAATQSSNVLYHGSHQLLKRIKPHTSTHGTSEVYATADRDFALCYCGGQWNDFSISQAYYNGVLMLTEIEAGAFKKFFDCSGYIYEVDPNGFTKLNNREYVCHRTVTPLSTTKIPNVLNELRNHGVKMYEYPNLPPYIKSHKEYIKMKTDFFNGDRKLLKDEISKSYDGNEAVITNVSPIVPYQQPALKKAESIDDPLLMRFPIQKKRKFPEVIATESNISLSKSKDNNSMSTPEELSKWMKKNIQYDHNDKTWRLRSTNQLISELKGDCHDQSNFEFDWFKSHGFRCIRLFMIEFNSKNGKKWWKQQCGSTHTILAYNKSKRWFWFENAWVNKAGIHGPYETINDLVNDICNEWTVNRSYDTLFVTELGNVMIRMTLDEYILANVPNSKAKYVFYKKLNKIRR